MADLKLAMVVSLVDKLTAPAKKLQRSVAGVTGKFGDAARKAKDVAEPMRRMAGRMDDAARAARRGADAVDRQARSIGRLGRAMGRINWGRVGRWGMSAAFVGAGAAGYGFKRLIDTAAQFEKFETVLETIEGSSEKARQSMQWVSDFAAKTPYELAEVNDAFVKLRAYGMDPTSGLMRTLGDTSSAMGKPIMQAVEAIADAVTGENERLKEFGVKARTLGEKIVYEYTVDGQTQTASADKSDRAAIESTLRGIFDSKFAGAMEKQSQTFDGMISNLMDQWTRFQQMVMSSGVFDWLKERLGGLLDKLNRMAENGRLQQWAEGLAQRLIQAFEGIESAAKFLWPIVRGVADSVLTVAQTLGGAGTAAALGGVFAVGPITQFAAGLRGAAAATTAAGSSAAASVSRWTMLGGAFKAAAAFLGGLSWPVIAIGAAVVAAGALIWKYWEPIKAFYGGLWAGWLEAMQPVTEALEPLWSGIKKVWDWIKRLFAPVEASEEQLASWAAAGKTVGKILGTVGGFAIRGVIEALKLLFQAGKRLVNYNPLVIAARAIYDNWDGIKAVVAGVGKWIVDYFSTGMRAKFLGYGKALIAALASGIKGSLKVLYEAVKFVLGPVAALLPSSDAKEGPLSRLTAAGESILGTMGAGVRRAGAEGLRAPLAGALAGAALAAPAVGAASPGAAAPTTWNITIHQQPGEDAQALVDRVIAAIEERRGADTRGALYDA